MFDLGQSTKTVMLDFKHEVTIGKWFTTPAELEGLEFLSENLCYIERELISRLERNAMITR
jgi:hypothetical protein